MFIFHWSTLLVVVVCGLVLFLGLALLMLRRRNEILQAFLTPEEPNLEEEFFRVRQKPLEEEADEETIENENDETASETQDNAVQWGTVQ